VEKRQKIRPAHRRLRPHRKEAVDPGPPCGQAYTSHRTARSSFCCKFQLRPQLLYSSTRPQSSSAAAASPLTSSRPSTPVHYYFLLLHTLLRTHTLPHTFPYPHITQHYTLHPTLRPTSPTPRAAQSTRFCTHGTPSTEPSLSTVYILRGQAELKPSLSRFSHSTIRT